MTHKLTNNYQIMCIVLIILGIYYPSIFIPFNSIDDLKMINSLLNQDSFSLRQLFMPNGYGQYYRPLLYLSFIADKYIWGLESTFMHLENIMLHLSNSLLVFWLTRIIVPRLSLENTIAPFVAALLFGLHPIATEPVNWVSGRTDLMSGFFVLLSFCFFLKLFWKKTSDSTAFKSDRIIAQSVSGWNYQVARDCLLGLFGALSLLAGCLSKETALFVLPVFMTWCVFLQKNEESDFVQKSVPLRSIIFILYGIAGTAYLFLRWLALSGGDKIVETTIKISTTSGNVEFAGVFDVLRVSTKMAGFYFKKLVFPIPLNFGINNISPHYLWLGLIVLCGVAWCAYKRDVISYLFLAAFMLTSSAFILPILKITWTPIAERYVYMASAPFVIGVTVLYIKYLSRNASTRLATFTVAGVLGCAAIITVQRNIIWQDNFTLFEDTVKKSPGFGAIKNEYAIALRSRGRIEEADRIMLTNVVDEFQPSSLNTIRIFMNQGKFTEARLMLLERLEKPSEYKILVHEMLLKVDEMRLEKAISNTEKTKVDTDILWDLQKLATISGDPFYSYRLGAVYMRLGDKKSAKSSYEKAYLHSPEKSHYREAAKKLAEKL